MIAKCLLATIISVQVLAPQTIPVVTAAIEKELIPIGKSTYQTTVDGKTLQGAK